MGLNEGVSEEGRKGKQMTSDKSEYDEQSSPPDDNDDVAETLRAYIAAADAEHAKRNESTPRFIELLREVLYRYDNRARILH
jgi:hypothetical protein